MRDNHGNKYFQALSRPTPSAWGVTRRNEAMRDHIISEE